MRDLSIRLADRPGALAEMGAALGAAGVSVEAAGLGERRTGDVRIFSLLTGQRPGKLSKKKGLKFFDRGFGTKLKQDQPGQLGNISRLMAEAGVNIEVIYSENHQNH